MPDVVVERDPTGAQAAIPSLDDRVRLTDAVGRAGAELGYAELEVEQIADYAGLDVDEFHRHFANRDQCLLAAFDRFFERMTEEADEACLAADSWPQEIKLTIRASLGFIAELNGAARLFVVDATRLGPAALERMWAAIDRAALRLRQGRRLYPAAAELPEAMEPTLVAGVALMVSTHLLAEDAESLPGLEAEAVELVLTPYIGTRRARQIAAA